MLLVDYKWPWPVLKKGWDTHNSCATLSSASCINESSWNWAESRANTIVRLGTGVIWRHLGLIPAPVDPQWFTFNELIYCWLYRHRHTGIQLYFIGMLKWKYATFLFRLLSLKYTLIAQCNAQRKPVFVMYHWARRLQEPTVRSRNDCPPAYKVKDGDEMIESGKDSVVRVLMCQNLSKFLGRMFPVTTRTSVWGGGRGSLLSWHSSYYIKKSQIFNNHVFHSAVIVLKPDFFSWNRDSYSIALQAAHVVTTTASKASNQKTNQNL